MARTHFTPLWHVRVDITAIIRLGVTFFESPDAFAGEVTEILFLQRQAEHNGDISSLALCVLFENLVRLMFDYFKLGDELSASDARVILFEQAKKETADWVSQQVPLKGTGYERLHTVIVSAQKFTIREIFQGVVQRLGLDWDGEMESVFRTWKTARNPSVHKQERAARTEDELRQSMLDESRIAGAINVLVLKLVGYSGMAALSILDKKFRKI